MAKGVLEGVRIVEFEGMGPAPFCGMMLADHGADVVRISRPGGNQGGAPLPAAKFDVMGRGRRRIELDLKDPAAIATCLNLLEHADAMLEGYRPGVMERLGLGPDVVLAKNPRLAYARMTGWGQSGPYSPLAGHDINYIATNGALHGIGPADKPVPPLNLVGDFGGGAMFMAFGVVSAILNARTTGQGQVIDCAMVDGATSLMAAIWGLHGAGDWRDSRESNLIDGGAHFYATYRCGDGKWVAVGAIEPLFYKILLDKLGLDDPDLEAWGNPAKWAAMGARFQEKFLTRSRDEWTATFAGTDACFAPILSMGEAPADPHNVARATFVVVDGVTQPAPAPRFLRTPGAVQEKAAEPDGDTILAQWRAQ
jgi:alpha-methylacyl-CoA racemase